MQMQGGLVQHDGPAATTDVVGAGGSNSRPSVTSTPPAGESDSDGAGPTTTVDVSSMNVVDRALAGTNYTKTDAQLILQLASLVLIAYWLAVVE
jgi:hypothetical protein